MGFNYYNEFYGYFVADKIRGTIGKKIIYHVQNGRQRKWAYYIPFDPKTETQLRLRDILRQAVLLWQNLSESERNFYRENIPPGKSMTGFNFFISNYINTHK